MTFRHIRKRKSDDSLEQFSDASNVKSVSTLPFQIEAKRKYWYTNKHNVSHSRQCIVHHLSGARDFVNYICNRQVTKSKPQPIRNRTIKHTHCIVGCKVCSSAQRKKNTLWANSGYEFRKRRCRNVMIQWFFHIHVSIAKTITARQSQNCWYCFRRCLHIVSSHTMKKCIHWKNLMAHFYSSSILDSFELHESHLNYSWAIQKLLNAIGATQRDFLIGV